VLEAVGVQLAVVGDRVALYDAETDEELGDYLAVSEALQAEVQARANAEQRERDARELEQEHRAAKEAAEKREREHRMAREAAEARVKELQEFLQRLQGSGQ
jgi:hypothetical protein